MQYHLALFILISTWDAASTAPQIKLSPYFANQTACFINGNSYEKGDLIPSDHPCEICRCRPPGFSCSYKHCPPKPIGCRTIEVEGQCCPDYDCGCTYDGRVYYDGQKIPHAPSPCVTCYCKRNIVRCALNECRFRYDCEPEYIPGQCCPRYDHCNRTISNHKNKFRSSDIQENTEPETLVKENRDEVGKKEETTEVVKVMRNEHRTKSSTINDLKNRLNVRKKKVYIGQNNKLLTESSVQSTTTMLPTSITTTELPLIKGIIAISSGLIEDREEPESMVTVASVTSKDFVDEISTETRKPPYEMNFEELSKEYKTTTYRPGFHLNNQDPLVEIITTEMSDRANTESVTTTTGVPINPTTSSPKSYSILATQGDEIDLEPITEEFSLLREENDGDIQKVDNKRSRMLDAPTLVDLKLDNEQNNRTSSPGYVRNIYKNTLSFFTSLIGRFG